MRKAAVLLIVVLGVFVIIGAFLMQSMFILQRVAGVSAVQGQVSVKLHDAADFAPLGTRQRVGSGDTIRTGPGSSVDLNWVDGTRIRLASDTTMTVRSCQINQSSGTETSLFDLSIGKIWVRVLKLLSQKSKFEVHTPTATAGVRGTIFSVQVDGSGKTSVSVDEGAVAVSPARAGTSTASEVQAKQAFDVGADSNARDMNRAELEAWQAANDIKGPLVKLSEPAEGAGCQPGGAVTVAGTVERGAQLAVNGTAVQADRRGRFATQIAIPAEAKAFEVKLVALDARGYSTTVTRDLPAR
jgi:hypothetical protein